MADDNSTTDINDLPIAPWAQNNQHLTEDINELPVAPWATAQAPQAPSSERWPWYARVPAQVGELGLKVGTDIMGMPGDIESLFRSATGLGLTPDAEGETTYLPTSETYRRPLRALGALDNPAFSPQGAMETIPYGLAEGGLAAAATPERTVATGIARLLPKAATGVAGAAGVQAMQQLDPDASPLLKATVGMAAALAGGRMAGTVGLAQDATARAQALQTAEANYASAKANAQVAGRSLEDSTIAAKRLQESQLDLAQQQEEAKLLIRQGHTQNEIAGIRGSPDVTAEQVGNSLQDTARGFLGRQQAIRDQIYQGVNQSIPGETPVETNAFGAALDRMQTDNPVVQELRSNLPTRLRGALDSLRPPELDADGNLVPGSGPSQMSWGDMRMVRDSIGNMLGNPSLRRGADESMLATLYRGVQQDMGEAADRLPPTATGASPGDLYRQATTEADRLNTFMNGPLKKITNSPTEGKESIDAKSVPQRLLNGDGQTLQDIRRYLGDDSVQPLFAHSLSEGPTKPWNKLSPEVQSAIAPDAATRGHLAAQFEDLARAKQDRDTAIDSLRSNAKQQGYQLTDSNRAQSRVIDDSVQGAQGAVADAKQAIAGNQSPSLARELGIHSLLGLSGAGAGGGVHALVSGEIGHNLGQLLGPHVLHGLDTLQSGSLGQLAAMGLPLAVRNSFGMLTPGYRPYLEAGALGALGPAVSQQ